MTEGEENKKPKKTITLTIEVLGTKLGETEMRLDNSGFTGSSHSFTSLSLSHAENSTPAAPVRSR